MPADTATRADALDDLRERLEELYRDATDILSDAPPEVRQRARAWLRHLDLATGTEETTTISDTVCELRAGESVAA